MGVGSQHMLLTKTFLNHKIFEEILKIIKETSCFLFVCCCPAIFIRPDAYITSLSVIFIPQICEFSINELLVLC